MERREALARASGDPRAMEAVAKRMMANADKRWGSLEGRKWSSQSEEEFKQRSNAAELMADAKKMREGEKTPWLEGVVATRGMSIGDVFNNMRGMGGARVKDPNVDANKQTAENTKSMKDNIEELCKVLKKGGVA